MMPFEPVGALWTLAVLGNLFALMTGAFYIGDGIWGPEPDPPELAGREFSVAFGGVVLVGALLFGALLFWIGALLN